MVVRSEIVVVIKIVTRAILDFLFGTLSIGLVGGLTLFAVIKAVGWQLTQLHAPIHPAATESAHELAIHITLTEIFPERFLRSDNLDT